MDEVLRPLLGLAPVACFLGLLVALDSYKLVSLTRVLAVLVAGGSMAGVSYMANGTLLANVDIGFVAFTRYIAPVVEELLKAAIVVLLIRTHRVGFLVDAAIVGFAAGTGFAMVENLLYLRIAPEATLGAWLVRGFGTAIMHGGATSIFAVMGLALAEREGRAGMAAFIPGFLAAAALHSLFNHFFFSPLISSVGIAVAFPLILQFVFARSEAAMGRWLGKGFDADTEMLELINSGRLSTSPVGRYLHQLKDRFQGPVVADLVCYLRLHTELALRAKGILMMRENGFDAPVDEATREKFAEMRYLEKSIGPTGRKALQPMLHMSHKDLWQLYMLGK
ncbi:MAG TPA: PrsW family glutamic-type intramembrane protease [Usitatibacter sp.]|nr:PrsW family glutamic-type intramembrane protease [Usitatibacter sp.]